ncbi:MAG TPA: methyltransferase domain-containing protein [Acidobacteriota bacterium]|nr:methyltransferase domain-containing protein [Acidobacteriota bacterium]
MNDLSFLKCPDCRLPLEWNQVELLCVKCGRSFPVTSGVFDLSTAPSITDKTKKTVAQFGESWKIFDHIEPYHKKQFAEWIAPFPVDDFKDKVVFEGGCGKGRHTLTISAYEPSRIVSVDLSEAIFIAASKMAAMKECLPKGKEAPETVFIRGDLKDLPVADSFFDIVFCVGVLHHIDDPRKGLEEMWRILKPGGKLLLWVYAREGNGWIVHLLDPLRKGFTSRTPTRFLRIMALPLTSFLFFLLKAVYGPSSGWGKRKTPLPYSDYLNSISTFPFREIDNIVVDHLCPAVAYYLSKEEIEKMFRPLRPTSFTTRWHHRNSWTVLAEKPGVSGSQDAGKL